MRSHPHHRKSLLLKILPVNPYNSKICMLSPVQLHCFHRPRGEGGTPPAGRLNPASETMTSTSVGESARATSLRNCEQGILQASTREHRCLTLLPRFATFFSPSDLIGVRLCAARKRRFHACHQIP